MDKKVSNTLEMEILNNYLLDYSVKFHIRELSRLVKRNHRSVSIALNRLETEGVLKQTTIGKNKEYSLNLSNILTKTYMQNAESAKTIEIINKHFIIKKLLTELSYIIKNAPIILFGSYAKGEETKKSDIDILIIKNGNEKILASKFNEFAARHNVRIQVQELTLAQFESGIKQKDHLIFEIVKSHVLLNNSELFIDVLWRHFNER